MRDFLRKWLGIDYIEDQIGQLTCDIENGLSDLQCDIENNSKDVKKDEKMSGYETIGDFTFSLVEKRPFEVVCVKSQKMIYHPGHSTHEDALAHAEGLAARYPGQEYMVYGPLSVSKADIPVVSMSWNDSSKEVTDQ